VCEHARLSLIGELSDPIAWSWRNPKARTLRRVPPLFLLGGALQPARKDVQVCASLIDRSRSRTCRTKGAVPGGKR
jgi:hypothetical protein